MSYDIFIEKKTNDEDEKYPDGKNLLKSSSKRLLKKNNDQDDNKVLISLSLNIENKYEVFGPKLFMKNNIHKKFCYEDE